LGEKRDPMILRNLSWLAVSQIFRLAAGLLVGTWVTRQLGPAQSGLLGTVSGIGSLASFLAELGLRQVLIKELAHDRSDAGTVFGTAIRIMVISGILCFGLSCFAAWWLGGNSMLQLGFILFLPILVNPYLAVLSRWDAAGQAQRTARLALGASILGAVIRAVLLLQGKGLSWIAGSIAIEALFSAVIVFVWCQKNRTPTHPRQWDLATAKMLLQQALPLVLAHTGTLLLLKTDQIMVYELRGDAEAGIYAAATRLSEIVYAAGPLVIMTFMPILSRTFQIDPELFQKQRAWLFGALTVIAYSSILFWLFASKLLVWLFYGQAFEPVAAVLIIHALAALPFLQGELRGMSLVIENKTHWSIRCALSAFVLNLILNFCFIPNFGAQGAAWATAISYTMAWYASSLMLPELKLYGREQSRALIAPFWLWSEYHQWRRIMR
jgi:O-antigen/teichoic acid export membrane protein